MCCPGTWKHHFKPTLPKMPKTHFTPRLEGNSIRLRIIWINRCQFSCLGPSRSFGTVNFSPCLCSLVKTDCAIAAQPRSNETWLDQNHRVVRHWPIPPYEINRERSINLYRTTRSKIALARVTLSATTELNRGDGLLMSSRASRTAARQAHCSLIFNRFSVDFAYG